MKTRKLSSNSCEDLCQQVQKILDDLPEEECVVVEFYSKTVDGELIHYAVVAPEDSCYSE